MFIKLNRRGKNQRFHNNGEKNPLLKGQLVDFLNSAMVLPYHLFSLLFS